MPSKYRSKRLVIITLISASQSSKIPRSLLTKSPDITMQSQMNEVSDPESKVKEILSEKYDLSGDDLTRSHIRRSCDDRRSCHFFISCKTTG